MSTTSYQHFKVEGLRELDRALANLPRKVSRRLGWRATAKGAALIRDEAKIKARFIKGYSEGTVKKNIMQFRPRRKTPGLEAEINVGVRLRGGAKKRKAARIRRRYKGGKVISAFPHYYWFMVEFGTSKMAAQPFLRPAFESRKHQAAQVMKDTLRESIVQTQAQST